MNFKYFILTLFSIGGCINLSAQDVNSFFQKSESFFKSVVEDGKVNYSSIQNNQKKLEDLTALITQVSPKELNPKQRKAFFSTISRQCWSYP